MKQVAIIIKDDVTELNKRLSTGFQINSNYRLENGAYMFILYKYETRALEASLQAVNPTLDLNGYSQLSGGSMTSYTNTTEG